MRRSATLSALIGLSVLLAPGLAAAEGPAEASVKPLFSTLPADLAGKRMTVVEVAYPPGGASSAHRHPGSVFAYVLSGHVRTQLEGETAPKVYGPGQSWYEPPGAHHIVSGNASATEPARFIAVLIGDDGAPLVTPDPKP